MTNTPGATVPLENVPVNVPVPLNVPVPVHDPVPVTVPVPLHVPSVMVIGSPPLVGTAVGLSMGTAGTSTGGVVPGPQHR